MRPADESRETTLGLMIAFGLMWQACGSSTPAPTTPTVLATPAPTPTPTPRQTVTLDAPADFVQYSSVMARVIAPQAYEFTVRPLRINLPNPSTYSHTVEIWLSKGPEVLSDSSLGFSASWLGSGRWRVDSYTPAGHWYYGQSRFELALGDTATFRITKHAAGIAEFFVNGISMESIEDGLEVARTLRARVVGTAAEISWVPVGLSSAAIAQPGPILPCLFCSPNG